MKNLILIALFCLLGLSIKTQEVESCSPDEQRLNKYLMENIKYPVDAVKNKIQGKVFVEIKLNDDGTIDSNNTKVLKGIGFGCDEEALRVIKKLPKELIPEIPERGYIQPIEFRLKKNVPLPTKIFQNS